MSSVLVGDCLAVLPTLEANSVDAIVCDPPYGLEFMGKEWDAPWKKGEGVGGNNAGFGEFALPDGRTRLARPSYMGGTNPGCLKCGGKKHGKDPKQRKVCTCAEPQFQNTNLPRMVAFQMWAEQWAAECLRVAKPGAHLVAFGGTRTHHRLACAIEDAGWEIRDTLMFLYGTGFPKSLNLGRDDRFCRCATIPEHDVRDLHDADVPATVPDEAGSGPVLLAGLPEQGAPEHRAEGSAAADARGEQPGMAGRRHDVQEEGELQEYPLSASAGVGAADGARRRVHHGASPHHGANGRASARPDGSGSPQGPRSHEQPSLQSGTVAEQSAAQTRGAWPTCDGCGKPRIPTGLGTALKPAFEPIILARKPLSGTVAATVAEWGTGALNIAGCRIAAADGKSARVGHADKESPVHVFGPTRMHAEPDGLGRWPANVCLSHSPECREVGTRRVKGSHPGTYRRASGDEQRNPTSYLTPPPPQGHNVTPFLDADGLETVSAWECVESCAVRLLDEQSGERGGGTFSGPSARARKGHKLNACDGMSNAPNNYGDTGGASRFFYCAKSSRREREAGLEGMPERTGGSLNMRADAHAHATGNARAAASNVHPTVKPLALMRWLCRLVTPPGGTILDPFAGSCSTGCAAVLEGFDFIGIEREAEYVAIGEARIAHWTRVAARYRRLLAYRASHPPESRPVRAADPAQVSLFGDGAA